MMGTSKKSGEAGAATAAERALDPKIAIFKVPPFLNKWNLDMRSSREFFVRVLRRPLKQFGTGTPLGRAKKTWSKMGTAAVAYIALFASRLPWFLKGAATAAAGAGYRQKLVFHHNFVLF